jgi:hypothetical protein
MALSANTVWEVRTTGDNTNGGGFVTGASGTDHSQQDAAQYSVTDAVTNGTTTITSATANFGTDVVGNLLYIQGGTGSITANWYQITARTNSTTITVDRSTGLTTGTGATLKIGGALASLAPFSSSVVLVDGNIIWMKSGTYSPSVTWTIGPGGGTASLIFLRGYGSTRGDGIKPVISSTSTGNALNVAGAGVLVMDIEIDGNDSALIGINFSSNGTRGAKAIRCKVSRCANYGFAGADVYIACEVTDLKDGGIAGFVLEGGTCYFCYVHDTPGTGFIGSNTAHSQLVLHHCIADTCTLYGFVVSNSGSDLSGSEIIGCIAYNNTLSGLFYSNGFNIYPFIINCILYGNGGYGIAGMAAGGYGSREGIFVELIRNNALGNNTSGNYQGGSGFKASSSVDLSADPFTNAAGGDFSLNNTAGGGAACRAVGFPGTYPGGLTTGYLDIGAVQHADSPATYTAVIKSIFDSVIKGVDW